MKKLLQNRSTPLVYLITDRRLLPHQSTRPGLKSLINFAQDALAAGVDMIQIRERDLCPRDLLKITEKIVWERKHPDGQPREQTDAGPVRQDDCAPSLLINDRADIAASAGAGVHLTTRSLGVEVIRESFPADLLVGVSTHTYEEAQAAELGGADFIVFGPVFETASKKEFGEPVGLEALQRVTSDLTIPVLALGGIKATNFAEALDAGASGIAGISMFTEAPDLGALVAEIKNSRVRRL